MSHTNQQREHYEHLRQRNELRAERLRRTRLSSDIVSVSSNAKWHKMFDCLQTTLDKNTMCTVKLLKQDSPWEYRQLMSAIFEDTYLDGMDGPLNYCEIEWIELDCTHIPKFDFIADMELGDSSVVIYGYRRGSS